MKTDDFDYKLPEELIASYPLENRDASRLLKLNKQTGEIADHKFTDFIDFINPGDLLVFNNSKVMLARLYGSKTTGAKLEYLIERIKTPKLFETHIKANRSPAIGSEIYVEDTLAKVLDKDGGMYLLEIQGDKDIYRLMEEFGHIPLPPYMKRDDEEFDAERYQTVYAQDLGSVAAPTAGLHFSKELMQQIKDKGVDIAYITLHVGSGTFKPVQVDDVESHKMHAEVISVPVEVCQKIRQTKANGGRVIAIGTTSVRSLETAGQNGQIEPYQGETDIFLYPGKKFNVVDAMITNFHLPKSTLIMLVSAFADKEKIIKAYEHAIAERYRFFSYGDAMFIF
ncbi:tRNA preQ1(34) S-adenosylmethionine ribosyltransferase-isomerase QueA [Francisella tularensis subsp. novicida]|uniref:tRNA preQ1(34) S-adenosylmethionine ribosyltransferase-isomerase QueA n=1 Tax=Francisella tularensis TaxID=263 RepID=UPI0002E9825A|nr:tRNA preQ1(34) S-adenosylmethionine ribosyltransferase-isomerase QueA [Francisella tularensis]AJI44941.1 tRNA ribosyltransferase-isomerase [Francisella tularensis subsp. novicida F6168]AJJ48053.1 tRNA ribosyltransferase-isomerase [Francisella tularensis subsp. novicida]APC98168.1 tRNA ribosyltransferase-isomerase [Francisella tularensis subsp. novicida]KFJ66657.1 tRNA ribosyltransferase-isomerase [Francisella tularensis subsp. novicida]MBK2343565.1 tRNA preQ1(34) S-adenosylmethionine ribosy